MPEPLHFGENHQPTGRRASRRVRISLPAFLETVAGRYLAELTSLSCGGAGLRLEEPPKCGSTAVVHCGGIEAFGTVVWSECERCGIKFDDRLTEAQVLAARQLSDHRPEVVMAQRMAAARAWAEGRRY
jgi:hypothetical protein